MSKSDAITLKAVGFGYEPGQWVLRDLSASIKEGTVCAVLGPNGRGKSTLIHLLLGFLTPTTGEVTLSAHAGFVPQMSLPTFPYSVLDMVLMGRARHVGLMSSPGQHDIEVAASALADVGLVDSAQRSFNELSGGQRQLVMVARALASEEDILILDEPTSGLDVRNQLLLMDRLRRLAEHRRLTVLFTTHQPEHALDAADVVLLLMGQEEPVLFGSPKNVMTEDNLSRLYGVPLKRVEVPYEGQICTSFMPMRP